jgi:uncharacterized C2H2 Zn-finger protein
MRESLQKELESRLQEREMEDAECVASAATIKSSIDEAYNFLCENQDSSQASVPLRRGYTNKFTGEYKAKLRAMDTSAANTVLHNLEDSFYQRKLVLKKMRKRARNGILEGIAEEMKAQLKEGNSVVTKGLVTSSRGGMSKDVRDQAKKTQKDLATFTEKRLNAVRSLLNEKNTEDSSADDAADEEGIDIDAYDLQDAERNPRGEPSFWQDFGDDSAIQIIRESDELSKEEQTQAGMSTEQDRIDFLKKFVAHTNRQSSGLTCRLCVADPTASRKAKEKKWVLNRLKLHYKGQVHSRRAQLANAFNAIKNARGTGDAPCPHCPDRLYRTSSSWLEHVEKMHTYELWMGENDEDDDEDVEDEFIAEGGGEGSVEREAGEEHDDSGSEEEIAEDEGDEVVVEGEDCEEHDGSGWSSRSYDDEEFVGFSPLV